MRFVAGQGAEAEHLVRGAAVAERHREEAGRGAVAKMLLTGEGRCGGAVAGWECKLAGLKCKRAA